MVDMVTADGGALTAKLTKVIELVDLHLTDPYLVTDETWGTGKRAEQNQQQWDQWRAPPPRQDKPAADGGSP